VMRLYVAVKCRLHSLLAAINLRTLLAAESIVSSSAGIASSRNGQHPLLQQCPLLCAKPNTNKCRMKVDTNFSS
jgi:hypothetical protein